MNNAAMYSWQKQAMGLFLLLLALHGSACQAQMVSGNDMPGFAATFGLAPGSAAPGYAVHVINSSVPGNVLWPGDTPKLTLQITNSGSQAIQAQGHVEVVPYGTHGVPGDIWKPYVVRLGKAVSVPIAVRVAPNGFQDVTVTPSVPARFGGYGLVLDMGPLGRQFITSVVRTYPVAAKRVQYPHSCLDRLPPPLMQRLGVHALRWEMNYKPTTDPDFAQWYAEKGKQLKAYQDAGVTVLLMAAGPNPNGPTQPLGQFRNLLDDKGVMQGGAIDIAWLPSYDADFQEFCHRFARDYGWPKGPITAFSLWNEPWEGSSISGWGADMLRYRDIYTHMWQGVNQARQQNHVQVLVGGCDSSSNALDKLFPDGKNTFGPMFDFLSIHYQGLNSTANYKQWLSRKGYNGRVKVWDTESWVGNTDDRVSAIVAADRAAGYDRAMGVFGGNICSTGDYAQRLADGTTQNVQTVTAWSTAASIGAASHFIGERPFQKLLFPNGLPWVMVFGGVPTASNKANPEDGTIVVVGDLGEEFGAGALPFRTVRGYAEIKHKAVLKVQMAALANAADAQKQDIQTQIDTPETLSSAAMILPASSEYGLYDFYGNPVPAAGGKIVVPLDGRGFFMRGSGKPGAFSHLLSAVRSSRISGIEPLCIVAHDFTRPAALSHALHLTLTNVLNRPVTGRLSVTVGSLTVGEPNQKQLIAANQTIQVLLPIRGQANAANSYPLTATFLADGLAPEVWTENIHADVITRRTITVDGRLDDWKGIMPQTIIATGSGGPTLTEQAWLPFKQYDTSIHSGLASAYLAYDDKNFYFAAKVADATLDPGMVRFATRDDDQYFYPPVSYVSANESSQPDAGKNVQALTWPSGVRRYSYRKSPELPSGSTPNHDNIQLAFNVLPEADKKDYPTVPGTMPGFVYYQDTDYEFALNPVAPEYGGGTEVWKLAAPNIPHKHFYPRQPKSPNEGSVLNAQLSVRRDGNTLVYECAIPWTNMPEAKARLEQGQTIKFSYRVNDNAGGPVMELSKGRSVAKRNNSFHVDWGEHWSNELEFGSDMSPSK
ncbi:MAG: hypothetical protein ACRYFS_07810 [Janthinobacterium lividum]